MKLNLGSGSAKLEGYINLDISEECKPDVVHDFRKGLPYPSGHFDKIIALHTIEHIEKRFHEVIFSEVKRVLKADGEFILTFPDWEKCAKNWLSNKNDNRTFWEATLYGRQLYPSDFHVCICTLDMMARKLASIGLDPYFQGYEANTSLGQDINAVIKCTKSSMRTYPEALRDSLVETTIK